MKDSGIGRENGIEAFDACEFSVVLTVDYSLTECGTTDTQSKSTIVNIASMEETRAEHDWFAENKEEVRYG